MATMHPGVIVFDKSEAERKVFTALDRALPNAYHALHHVALLKMGVGGRAVDDEIDFVIVHPELGVMVLEVKGGLVSYDPATGRWSSSGTNIRDPFDQATDAKYGLARWLSAQPGWRAEWGPFGHAVIFPDGVYHGAPMPKVDRRIVFDADDLADRSRLRVRLENAFSLWKGAAKLGTVGCAFVVSALDHAVGLKRRPGEEIEGPDREIIQLSPQQFNVLNAFMQVPRASISGPAGAGKTLMAVEATRRLAAQGKQTLLVCFNKELASHLVAEYQRSVGDSATIKTYSQLCVDRARGVGFRLPALPWDRRAWDVVHASLDKTATMAPGQFDAIVVDEGQDFAESWWLPLVALLRDSDKDRLYIFYDSNQRLFKRPPGMPDGLIDLFIWENWRNTHQIFKEVMQHYQGHAITPMGPKNGVAVERHAATAGFLSTELGRVLQRIIIEGKTSSRDIVVLTGGAVDKSRCLGRCGRFNLCLNPTGPNDVRLTNVYRFKGLDSKVVIVVETDPTDTAKMYVASSRARALLVMIATVPKPGA